MADFNGSLQAITKQGAANDQRASAPFAPVIPVVNLQSTGITPGNNVIDIPMNGTPLIAGLSADPKQYTILPLDGGVGVTVLSVAVVGNSLHLVTTEHTNAKSYQLQIPGCGLVSTQGQPYVGLFAFTYTGVGLGPTAVSATGIDARTIFVTFSKPVVEAEALVASNYNVSPSLTVMSVLKLSSTMYQLTTSRQVQGTSYTITVSGIHDLDGNNLI